MNHDRKSGRGQLNYEASFFPTLALAHQATEEELKAKEKKNEKYTATQDAKKNDKEATSITTEPVDSTEPTELTAGPPTKDLHGEPIKYTDDKKIDLLSYESGVLTVKIHEVVLPQKAKAVVEILLDSNDAQFRTSEAKGTTLSFQESGDAFVKEMDFSRLVVCVRNPKHDNEEHRLGFWTDSVRNIVQDIQTQSKSENEKEATDDIKEYKLLDCPNGLIRLSFKFIPVVQFKLDPSESLESK